MRRRYKNPPVVEALCEVYFEQSAWDTTVPGRFYERVRDRFPKKDEFKEVSLEWNLESGAAKPRPPEPRSRFTQENGARVLQVARNLIVVNQMRPYPAFEEWRPLVLEAVGIYRDLARPSRIERVGVRYLNRIEVPRKTLAMEEYFQLYPEIPRALGTSHGTFMLRIEIPPKNLGHQLVVTFGSAKAKRPESQAFLLDLYDLGVPADPEAIGAMEHHLDAAHENVELAFESIITDSTRALFEDL